VVRKAVLASALTCLLILLATAQPASAQEINIVSTPPEELKGVKVHDLLALNFSVEYTNSNGSIAMIVVSFDTKDWSYKGFKAEMNGKDITNQFDFIVDGARGTIELSASSLQPANGILTVHIFFEALKPGSYVFGWASTYVLAPLPPGIPRVEMKIGECHVVVSGGGGLPVWVLWAGASILVIVLAVVAIVALRRRGGV